MPIDPTTTNFQEKDMSGRDLRHFDFTRHRVMRANFTGADLRGVSFREADCTGANFAGANLEGADFAGAIINEAKLAPGFYDLAKALIVEEKPPAAPALPEDVAALKARIAELEQRNQELEAWNRALAASKGNPTLEVTIDPTLPDDTLVAVNPDGSSARLINIRQDEPLSEAVRNIETVQTQGTAPDSKLLPKRGRPNTK